LHGLTSYRIREKIAETVPRNGRPVSQGKNEEEEEEEEEKEIERKKKRKKRNGDRTSKRREKARVHYLN